jgi:hypothetical protein
MKCPAVVPQLCCAGGLGVAGVVAGGLEVVGAGVVDVAVGAGVVAVDRGVVAVGVCATVWVTVFVVDPPHPAAPRASARSGARVFREVIRGNLPTPK